MRIGCLLAAHLPAQVEMGRDAALRGRPLVIGGHPWEREKVIDCSAEAEEYGVRVGIRLRQAEQLCPVASFLRPDEGAYEEAQRTLKEALLGFSPWVEMACLGLGYVEVSGLGYLYGPEWKVAHAAARAVGKAAGLEVRMGIGANKFTARLAAEVAGEGRQVVVPAGHEEGFLAGFPLRYLPCDEEILRCFHRLGLRTFGDLTGLGKAAVTKRFGAGFGRFYDLARGIDPIPLVASRVEPRIEKRTLFEEPAVECWQVSSALSMLTEKAGKELKVMGKLCRGLRIEVAIASGERREKALHLKAPTYSVERLGRIARDLLEAMAIRGEVGELALTLFPLASLGEGFRQAALFDPLGNRRERLENTLRALRDRWGEKAIRRASTVGPPEPLPIEVVTDQREYPQSLVWAGRTRRVVGITEHWRVEGEWWRREMARYYYRLLIAGSLITTIFRDRISGRWYLERRRVVT